MGLRNSQRNSKFLPIQEYQKKRWVLFYQLRVVRGVFECEKFSGAISFFRKCQENRLAENPMGQKPV